MKQVSLKAVTYYFHWTDGRGACMDIYRQTFLISAEVCNPCTSTDKQLTLYYVGGKIVMKGGRG